MPPTLDRRITLHVETEGMRVKGKWVPGVAVDYEVWAKREVLTAESSVASGLDRTERAREYLIRYDARFLVSPERLTLTDPSDGLVLNVNEILEDSESARRRFLKIEAVSNQ